MKLHSVVSQHRPIADFCTPDMFLLEVNGGFLMWYVPRNYFFPNSSPSSLEM